MAPRRVLLVDDDTSLASIVATALEDEGFEVEHARDGLAGLRAFEARPADLVVLDVLMPEMDGLEVCRRLRARSPVPILMLTSRAEEVDRVTGLDCGADDYVTKPFSVRELCARLRALVRRAELSSRSALPAPVSTPDDDAPVSPPPGALGAAGLPKRPLTAGQVAIDPARFEARWRGAKVELTRAEFFLLATLVRHRGFVLSREQLLGLARDDDAVVTERTVDTLVKRLRKKLKEVDDGFAHIETVIGIGYRWREG